MLLLSFLSKTLLKIAILSTYMSKRLYKPPLSPRQKRVIPWFQIQGDKSLRLDYDLNTNSIVFDIGGYEGKWAANIFSKYCCFIHIFEPVIEFASRIENKFSRNKKVTVYKFGLSNENKTSKISVDKNSSSFYESGNTIINARLVRAIDFIRKNRIGKIDLMKINIEGGEYDLLEHLIDSGFIKNITNVQVQFHDFIPNAKKRMESIQKMLKKTHRLTYQYIFVWENWVRK